MEMIPEKYNNFFIFLLFICISRTSQRKINWRALKDFPEECFTASQIDDKTRVFNNYLVPTATEDDLLLHKGWYRFTGRWANSLKSGFGGPLPGNKDNAPNFCGTVYPGTLMGSHPTVEEGIVAMTVCFRDRYCFYEKFSACECKSKKIIYVRNCLAHFIYWLVPTARFERYCTSKTWLLRPTAPGNTSNALECKQYREINDASRVWNTISEITSERAEGWVRFGALSGNEIASACTVNLEHTSRITQPCGAKYRGWMIDSHPSLMEGRVERRICFSYTDRCTCEFYSNIAVRNCGNYTVYNLRAPPFETARYCGAPSGSSFPANDVTKPRFESKDICNTSTRVYDIDRLWANTNPTVSKCDANLYGAYRFGTNELPFSMKVGCNKTDMFVIHNRCSTKLQGFMERRHPTVNEGYVDRIICFQSSPVPCECQYSVVIGVQNCGGYFAYDLRGVPMCDARYCMVVDSDTGVAIDTSSQSLYGIPSNYQPVSASETAEFSSILLGRDSPVTAALLSIILLVLCVLLVILILLIVCLMRPWYKKKLQQMKMENADS